MNAASQIAQLLFNNGIRLKDGVDNLALGYVTSAELKNKITHAYLDAIDWDVGFTLNGREVLASLNDRQLIFSTVFQDIEKQKNLIEDIDYELWNLQCIEKQDRADGEVIHRAQIAA